VEFNRVALDEIVGNRESEAFRAPPGRPSSLLRPCRQKKPDVRPRRTAAGEPGLWEPGTGKSMLIAAMATMLDGYCRQLGLPFLFWPMPDTVVSTFQGGSAERMMSLD